MDEEALKPVDRRIVQILVENHARFRTYLARRVSSESAAEDLLQQSLKKAIEAPAESKDDISVVAWFYKILRNSLTDYYRSESSNKRKLGDFSTELKLSGKDRAPSPDDLESAICECLNGLLPTLKESYAELIQRIDLKGEPIRQVSDSLGISENNLNVRLYRARQALKKSLEKSCGTCTEHGCLDCTCSTARVVMT